MQEDSMKKLLCVLVVVASVFLTGCLDSPFGGGGLGNFIIESTPSNLLFLEKSYYYTSESISPSRPEVFISFKTPAEFGATSYTVQYSATGVDGSWDDLMNGGFVLTTDNPNAVAYSIEIPADGWLRLAIAGGTYDGQYSNKVFAKRCITEADVSYMVEENMSITGTSPPNIGYGLRATFTVVDPDDNVITDAFTYQWYRVDPNDWEDEILILGATTNEYVTTTTDKGYKLLIKASGKNDKFNGGSHQFLSQYVVGYYAE